MPALLSLILENFLELLFNLISQLPSLFGLDRRSKRRKRSESPPNYARLMFYSAILGALIGIAAVMVFPALALKPNSWGAFTCVSNVLLLGVVAELYGRLRKKLGKPKMP